MSVRVSISRPLNSACSGLMYAGVPMNCSNAVNNVLSVSRWSVVALAMPKSITFGMATVSCCETRIFDGLRSRWMIPFW
jgi:hypothetical protein